MKKEVSAILFLYLFVIACLIIFWMTGCKTAKDNRAFRRVVSDPELAAKTFSQLEKTRPCIGDTVIFGEDKIIIDTVYNESVKDSIIIDTVENTITKTIIKTKPVYITKTITKKETGYIEDVRRINLLKGDIHFRDGKIAQLEKEKKDERKRGNGFMWMLVGLIAFIMVGVFVKLKTIK